MKKAEKPEAFVKNTDTEIASLLVLLYFVLVIALLPRQEHVRAVISGAGVFGLIAGVAKWTGRGALPGMSVLAVSILGAAVLVMPTFPAMGGENPSVATPIGFFGTSVAAILWAALRWRELPPKHQKKSLREALRFGALMATGFSLVAAIPILLMFLTATPHAVAMLLVFPAYFAGFLTAAVFYWVFQSIDHLAVGRYALGALGGFCVYMAIGPVTSIADNKPIDLRDDLLFGLVCGTLVGPAVALGSDDDEKRMRNRKKLL